MIQERLSKIRELFNSYQIHGYLIGTADEYLSEYTPSYAKRLEYITNFNGSNGLAIILQDTVLFFTDGRYLTQSREQLNASEFIINDIANINEFPWEKYLPNNEAIGYDPRLFTRRNINSFSRLNMLAIEENLIDRIWIDQPLRPSSIIYSYENKFAGQDYLEKINKCRQFIRQHKAEALLITNVPSVCWLFNIRANDVEFSPLLCAYALITLEKAILFTDISRFPKAAEERPAITIIPEEKCAEEIKRLNGKILFDNNTCSFYVTELLESKDHQKITDPTLIWKALKNEIEIDWMIKNHIQDAVAMCEFLAMLAKQDLSSYSEYDLIKQLTAERSKRKNYIMDSFNTICGYQGNGAIIHYNAKKETAKKIRGNGLLLIDSGGQYLGATTDITRTVKIEDISAEYKTHYTNVLKGHIALGTAIFPRGKVTGAHLDVLARQYLWQEGKDYAHGTGHGVGSFLSVHEGPQSISYVGYSALLEKNMVVSNEPGYYEPGRFGIRIENLMYIKDAQFENYLTFEMLTLVPYAKDLIDITMLTDSEKRFIINYYQKISLLVRPLLSTKAEEWLNNELMLI